MEDPAARPATSLLEPVTAVRDPPGDNDDRHDREELIPEGKPERRNLQQDNSRPEYLPLHSAIVRTCPLQGRKLSIPGAGLLYKRRMKRTLREIAEFVGASLLGDPQVEVSGIASVRSAGPADLVFVESEKNLPQALASRAAAVISGDFASRSGVAKPLLIAVHPRLAFARAGAWLRSGQDSKAGIHESAVVDPSAKLAGSVRVEERAVIRKNAEIGEGTRIGAGCVVGPGVRIGCNCRVYPNVTIYPGTTLCDRVIVHAGSVLGSDGFGYVRDADTGRYEKFPQIGQLEIEDDVEIGANCTVDRGALEVTRIRRGTKIDNLVHVGHNVDIGEDVVIAAQTGVSGSSVIENGVIVGGQVGIADHVRIEAGAILGAQSGIPSKKVIRGKGIVFWGTPARPIKEYLKELAALARLTKKRSGNDSP